VNLLLRRKASNFRDELEAGFSLEIQQSIAQRAADWLSESPSPQNPPGLRPDFLDYVIRLLQPSAHG
jgi:hypothetical protein